MSLETPFQLKHTNVSRPQLSHSGSTQSITASEGYYSLSDHAASSESDDKAKTTPGRYHTPPSRNPSPLQRSSNEHSVPRPEPAVTSLKGIGIPRHQAQVSEADYPLTHTVSTIAEERPDTQDSRRTLRPAPAAAPRAPAMDSESLATTPGMDDTPYIRFAIDQLTRDEEVRGSRLYPQVNPADDEDYPVERIISDDGLGYMDQERRASHPPPSKPPKHTPGPSGDSTVQRDIFVPFRPTSDSHQHLPLHFLPSILRPLWLGLFIFLCALMLAALIFTAIYSNRDNGAGLWDYLAFGDNRYFVFEYLPTMLGMVVLMWLFQIQIALQRVVPFISMASDSPQQRSEAVFLQLYPMQFLLPKLEYFKAGQPLVGACFIVFWLFSWTIPLLASSFNVRFDLNSRVWRWVAVQGIIWTVIVLYILLVVAVITLLVFLVRKQTGLKWDPRSLADIIALLERSNIMNDYNGAETFEKDEFRQRLGGRTDRLGYWSTTRRPNDVFYGIGEEGGATRRYSIEQGRIREKGPERAYPEPLHPGASRPGDFSIRMDIRSPSVRLKYLPWYLRDTSVVAWIVTATVLLIAWYVVSFVNGAVRLGFLPQVYARTNSAGFSASNFLYSFIPGLIGHFLFLVMLTFDYSVRALTPYIALSSKGGATAEASLLVDYSYRLPISATLAALENRHFQPALLSFVSLLSVTLPIIGGGCFWTQYYPGSNIVRVAADLPGYYALCFFNAVFAIGLLALIPGRRRGALPHRSSNLAEVISWVYQSQILTDRAFARPQTKPELVTRLMGTAYLDRPWGRSLTALVRPSRDNLQADAAVEQNEKGKSRERRKDRHSQRESDAEKRDSVLEPRKIRYGFGIHVGRDGLEHLGIDRVRRGGTRSGRELVIWEEQRRRSWAGSV
ncbi:hypothetical protein BCR34DRAFT_376524 [Clohesyomyces aquaticus]|uniref:Phosphoribosylaminoimidazole-succinocarboxamide synthase n=1 Tax=Clohesyomyces aquaticus TaxID=1231657 RepID=A0A1Y1ZG48_9PLEO|nr:hypothetical protein BCR34DRAFT_376524 [Clohesyomyces aquaticus]